MHLHSQTLLCRYLERQLLQLSIQVRYLIYRTSLMRHYGFEDYHSVDIGVVKAARLWYSCVAGELLLEIPIEEGDTKLGFAISRTEEVLFSVHDTESLLH
jgi:hypothetical protein